jgi:hypothetical protein
MTHPAEVNEALGIAFSRCHKLIDDAERRGDHVGADAWLTALRAIEAAEKTMRDAREKQTWRTTPGERVDASRWAPQLRAACPSCSAAVGQPCVFTPTERHILGDADHVHRMRANKIGMDLKPL